jgi:hypothetical protein
MVAAISFLFRQRPRRKMTSPFEAGLKVPIRAIAPDTTRRLV